ncbi:isoflavone reductase-like [Mercurialis annua]|uniref:isoflavone reductase-like n=1 Tax=Mercurialis annua TaxID=3986 RepID=UPI0024ACF277|nr:isoflavone reductase-like [Mercurialis annua]
MTYVECWSSSTDWKTLILGDGDGVILERLANKLELHTIADLKTETIAVRKLLKGRDLQNAESTKQITNILVKFERTAGVDGNIELDDCLEDEKSVFEDEKSVFVGLFPGVFLKDEDVAAFTIYAIDYPRTLNKTLNLRPPGNVYSLNELVEVWESKIGKKKLERNYVPEDQLLKSRQCKSDFYKLGLCQRRSHIL